MTTRHDWVRTAALGGVIVATAVLSYSTLRERAVHIGFDGWASWLYPVGLDTTILGAGRAWRDSTASPRTRALAAGVTITAIGAAVAAFVAEFARYGPVAVGFAVLIPLALAATLVLTSWSAADRRAAAAEQERQEAEAAAERERRETARASRTRPAATPARVTTGVDRGVDSTAATPRRDATVTKLPRHNGRPPNEVTQRRLEWARRYYAEHGELPRPVDVEAAVPGQRTGYRTVRRLEAELESRAAVAGN